MKNLFIIILYMCLPFILIAQNKFNVAIGASPIWDRNWDIPFQDFQIKPDAIHLQTSFPSIAYGVSIEYSLSNKYKIGTGITFLHRNIAFHETFLNSYSEGNFFFQTIEMPLFLTYRKLLTNDIAFITLFGGSADYIISSSEKMGDGYNADTIHPGYKWNIINPHKLIPSIIGGFGLENDFSKYGRLQIGFVFHYQIIKRIKYKVTNYFNFEETSSAINASYCILSLKYFLPLFNNYSK